MEKASLLKPYILCQVPGNCVFSIESVGGGCECSLAGTKPKADFEVEIYIRHLPEYALVNYLGKYMVLLCFAPLKVQTHNFLKHTLS